MFCRLFLFSQKLKKVEFLTCKTGLFLSIYRGQSFSCKNQRYYGILYDIAEGGNYIGAADSRSKKTGEFVANCDEILIEFMDHP